MTSAETVENLLEDKPEAPRGEHVAKKMRNRISSGVATMIVLVSAIFWTNPTIGQLETSVRPQADVANTGWWTFFTHPSLTLSNYHTVLFVSGFGTQGGLMPYIVNSLAICIPATIFPLVIASMAAYCLAWVRFRGSDTIFFIIFALQVVPIQMALVPLLKIFTGIPGAGGTYIPVWVAHTIFALPLAIFLLHNFINQLPGELMEAALVDGASHFRIFRSLVLPLAAPALASFAIFQFLWVWNDLLVALTFTTGQPDVAPVTQRLAQLSGGFGSRWELTTAGAFVSIVIPLIVFFSLQRYFVRGLLAGSVKG
jgi:alpha-glucoside transport system permease protein